MFTFSLLLVALLLSTTQAIPSQVTGVSLSIVSWQATLRVNWNKPIVEGTFIRYDVQYRTSSQSWDTASTRQLTGENIVTVDLPNLQRGTTYNVRVRAVSNAGTGLYSAEATSTVPRFPPQVTGVRLSVVSGQAAIRVTWTNPSVEGTFLRYDVQYKISSQSWDASRTRKVTDKNTVTVDLLSLQRGTTYKVRVSAVSNAGTGLYSVPEATITLPRLPSRVTGVRLSDVSSSSVSGQAAIKVTWTKPSSDSTIIRYNVQYGPSSAHTSGWTNTVSVQGADSLTATLTGLGRRSYDVRVLAVSDAGVGLYSATSTLSTARVPSQVNQPTVTKAVSSGRPALNVSWSAPQSDSSITKYELQYKTITESSWMSRDVKSTTTTLTNLDSGTEYAVRVRAVSGVGNGPFSMERRQTTFNVPSQITGVKLSDMSSSSVSGLAAIKVTWTKSSSDRPIIRYAVQYGPSPARWSNTVSVQGADSLTTTLTGLGRRSYDVRVLAVSDAGIGVYSTTSTLSTARVPSQVNPPTVTKAVFSGKPALNVSWSAPQSDSSITKYELQHRKTPSGGWMSRDVTSTATTLPNLDADTEYAVQVRAVSGVGNGPFSREKRQTTFNVNPLGGANNDSVIGDPLFTIPLQTQVNSDGFDQEPASLCFEFNGRANKQYNLISDQCTFVNAHYAPASADPTLHIISEIGIRTKATSSCHDVRVDLEGCLVTLDGRNLLGSFQASGFTLTTLRNRVRISTDNCISGRELVMWIVCDEQAEMQYLRLVVSRGAAILPTGHGLIGQFWSIPVELVPYHGPYGLFTTVPDDIQAFNLTFMPEDMPPRSVIAELAGKTWDNTKKPCLYAGNGMGGPIVEAPPEFAFGSVIEGKRDRYEVASLFEHDFQYSKFLYDC